jgi:hypothetical protein
VNHIEERLQADPDEYRRWSERQIRMEELRTTMNDEGEEE